MKKEEVKISSTCDICGKDSYDVCLNCGKDICWKCAEEGIFAKKYSHAVDFTGTMDGVYCIECDKKLSKTKEPLHEAYKKLTELKRQWKSIVAELREKGTVLEKEISNLWQKKKYED